MNAHGWWAGSAINLKMKQEVAVSVHGGITIQRVGRETAPLLHPAVSTSPTGSDAGGGEDKMEKITTYWWRWVVLFIFSLNNAVTNYIWIMSAVIADLMSCYYGISDTMVNYLTTSYMMLYVVLVWPVAWVMDRYGLRLPVVVGSAAMAVGAALRVAGSSE